MDSTNRLRTISIDRVVTIGADEASEVESVVVSLPQQDMASPTSSTAAAAAAAGVTPNAVVLQSVADGSLKAQLRVAYEAMDRRTLRFKSAAVEAQYRNYVMDDYAGLLRVRVAGNVAWMVAIGFAVFRLAAADRRLPLLSAILYCLCLVAVVVCAAVVCFGSVKFLERNWNAIGFSASALFVSPVFLLLAACVVDDIAPTMPACMPRVPDVIPLLPMVLAIVSPHLVFPISRASWYVVGGVSVVYFVVVGTTLVVARAPAGQIAVMVSVTGINVILSSLVAYLSERAQRAGIWLSLVTKRGAAALVRSEDERAGMVRRVDAFATFAAASRQILYELDDNNCFQSITSAVIDLLCVLPSCVVGKPHTAYVHEEDVGTLTALLANLRLSGPGATKVQQFRRIRPDSSIVWVEMVAVIQKTRDGIAVLASERDVTEERRAREAVALERHRRVMATAAQAAHEETLGYACHELRNPLHGIIASADLLVSSGLQTAQQEQLSAILLAARQMRTLVDDILDVERLRAGKLTLHVIPASPAELLRNAVTQVADFASVPISYEVVGGVPSLVFLAAERVSQVLNNGLTNACKFCHHGSIRARVFLGDAPNTIRFEVRNTGHLPDRPLFRAFETGTEDSSVIEPPPAAPMLPELKVSNSSGRLVKGSGLGLRISTSLVEALGGTIELEELPELDQPAGSDDMETVFWFQIPVTYQAGMASMTVSKRNLTAISTDDGPVNLGLHVLYVDDEPLNRRVGAAMLARLGCTSEVLEDGDQVLPAGPQHYDVILMDIIMHRMHGTEVMQQLRAAGFTVPCFAVSGNTDAASVQKYLKCGFADVMGKPFTRAELRTLLEPVARARATMLPGTPK